MISQTLKTKTQEVFLQKRPRSVSRLDEIQTFLFTVVGVFAASLAWQSRTEAIPFKTIVPIDNAVQFFFMAILIISVIELWLGAKGKLDLFEALFFVVAYPAYSGLQQSLALATPKGVVLAVGVFNQYWLLLGICIVFTGSNSGHLRELWDWISPALKSLASARSKVGFKLSLGAPALRKSGDKSGDPAKKNEQELPVNVPVPSSG